MMAFLVWLSSDVHVKIHQKDIKNMTRTGQYPTENTLGLDHEGSRPEEHAPPHEFLPGKMSKVHVSGPRIQSMPLSRTQKSMNSIHENQFMEIIFCIFPS